jgi:hypothetical protein
MRTGDEMLLKPGCNQANADLGRHASKSFEPASQKIEDPKAVWCQIANKS